MGNTNQNVLVVGGIIDKDRVVFTVPEVARMLGINRCFANLLARDGRLPAIRRGGRVLIPRY